MPRPDHPVARPIRQPNSVSSYVNLVRTGIASADEAQDAVGLDRQGGAADQLVATATGGRPLGTGDGAGGALPPLNGGYTRDGDRPVAARSERPYRRAHGLRQYFDLTESCVRVECLSTGDRPLRPKRQWLVKPLCQSSEIILSDDAARGRRSNAMPWPPLAD